jgi:hypothetical protein
MTTSSIPSVTLSSRESALSFLQSEIDVHRQSFERNGWTHWALIGAGAGLVWLFLGHWPTHPAGAADMLRVALAAHVLHLSLRAAHNLGRDNTRPAYGRMGEMLSGPSRVALHLCVSALLAVLAWSLAAGHLGTLLMAIALTFHAVLDVFALVMLTTGHSRLPVPIGLNGMARVPKVTAKIFATLLLTVHGVALASFVSDEHSGWFTETGGITTLRLGLLIWAIIAIALFRISSNDDFASLDALVRIRRRLLLQEMGPDDAIAAATRLLEGTPASKLFDEDIRAVNVLYSPLESDRQYLQALRTSFEAGHGDRLDEAEVFSRTMIADDRVTSLLQEGDKAADLALRNISISSAMYGGALATAASRAQERIHSEKLRAAHNASEIRSLVSDLMTLIRWRPPGC